MWPFRRHTEVDPVSLRLAGFSSDILVLYERMYRLETTLAKLDRRVADLEKVLKTSTVRITIVEK